LYKIVYVLGHNSLLQSLLKSSIHVREILLKVALNTKTLTLCMYVELHLRQTRITIHFLSWRGGWRVVIIG